MSRIQDGKLMEFGGGGRVKREWQDIQPELLMKIVSLLDDRTVIVASGVCSGWRNVICTQLTRFSLSWCTNNINNLVLSLVPKFTNLRVLTLYKLNEPRLDDNAVETIANNCHDLEHLDLSMNSRLGDRSLYALARGCPNLTKLDISCCSAFTDKGLDFLSRYCRKLKILNLFGCYKAATNKAMKAIGDNCRQLESINLGWCYKLGDRSLYALARGCPNLTNLNISRGEAFRDKGLEFVSSYCRKLKILNLFGCYKAATNKAMKAIGDNCRQLESINLGWCYKLGDAEVMSLVYGCPNLNAIDLCQCLSITDESVMALANNCLHLRSLGLCHCHNITDQAMYALAHGQVKSKDEVLGGSVKTQYEEEGLTYLNISYCKALTPPAVQTLCDSFPALHTCPSRRSLIMNGCSNLTSVHCACDSQSHRASLPA